MQTKKCLISVDPVMPRRRAVRPWEGPVTEKRQVWGRGGEREKGRRWPSGCGHAQKKPPLLGTASYGGGNRLDYKFSA